MLGNGGLGEFGNDVVLYCDWGNRWGCGNGGGGLIGMDMEDGRWNIIDEISLRDI